MVWVTAATVRSNNGNKHSGVPMGDHGIWELVHLLLPNPPVICASAPSRPSTVSIKGLIQVAPPL